MSFISTRELVVTPLRKHTEGTRTRETENAETRAAAYNLSKVRKQAKIHRAELSVVASKTEFCALAGSECLSFQFQDFTITLYIQLYKILQ